MKKSWIFACMLLGLTACSSSQVGKSIAKPNYSKAYEDYLSLGVQYVQMGRLDLAEPRLKRAIEIDAEPPEAWNVLAVLYEEKRDVAAGYQIYEKLISSHPDYALGYQNFATFLCKFEREPERVALHQKMRAKNADFQILSYISEGDCLISRNNLQAAKAAYQQAVQVASAVSNPIPPIANNALLPLARMAQQQGDNQSALQYLRVLHTQIGYSAESVAIAIRAARALGDRALEDEMMRVMRGNYHETEQAKEFGL